MKMIRRARGAPRRPAVDAASAPPSILTARVNGVASPSDPASPAFHCSFRRHSEVELSGTAGGSRASVADWHLYVPPSSCSPGFDRRQVSTSGNGVSSGLRPQVHLRVGDTTFGPGAEDPRRQGVNEHRSQR
ncbi:hypothetical protein PVAP13_5KG675400 [Panicum virgatum]|uniref:Uncharacterized protein n=1 Tax=Panicum virgatum TaxID=38727 RepID=A0A8T0SU96_PANVG|nr:hypothetical protein PVAP13_5KG675400 [Panicum virgatum]